MRKESVLVVIEKFDVAPTRRAVTPPQKPEGNHERSVGFDRAARLQW